jgi:osomolarity two-component system response regulator SSK1
MASGSRPSSPVLSKGSEIASRIKAKLTRSRRRKSAAPSLESSWSDASNNTTFGNGLPRVLREKSSNLSAQLGGGSGGVTLAGRASPTSLAGDAEVDAGADADADGAAAAAAAAPARARARAGSGGAPLPGSSDGASHSGHPSVSSASRHLTKPDTGSDLRQTSSLHPSSALHSIHEASTSSTFSSAFQTSTPGDDDDEQDDHRNRLGDAIDAYRPLNRTAPTTPVPKAPAAEPAAADSPSAPTPASPSSGLLLVRRQSLLSNRQTSLINTLLRESDSRDGESTATGPLLSITDQHTHQAQTPAGRPSTSTMVARKIWVKRPGASATLVSINEEDLVDDVRDMILRKYANSLGRSFDSPDLALRICPREQHKDRSLGPEEPMWRTLEAYFPGGQTVDEALVIDVPRRTPRPSPRVPIPHPVSHYYTEDGRPSETGEGYFPPVVPAAATVPSPHLPLSLPHSTNGSVAHSISVLGTGHIPPIPSPGGTRRAHGVRPRVGRTHTSSPTVHNSNSGVPLSAAAVAGAAGHGMQHYVPPRVPRSRTHSFASDHSSMPPAPPPLPVSPGRQDPPQARVATPPPRISSPRPTNRTKKSKKADHASVPGMLNNSVPPISVLIVEDNPINLKLLEAFVKKLKVRWQTAMNGRDAVTKWRKGGFHLVLMDIQLPVMNGLEATREIRRLERVNSIGVFSQASEDGERGTIAELKDEDRLENSDLFKSPVIIVALTASSLQSDRHEALAAGCNDFLTKPVNFVWLERKVMEWGCMQALIDFNGWRQWKDFSQAQGDEAAKKAAAAAAKAKTKKNRTSLSSPTTAAA